MASAKLLILRKEQQRQQQARRLRQKQAEASVCPTNKVSVQKAAVENDASSRIMHRCMKARVYMNEYWYRKEREASV